MHQRVKSKFVSLLNFTTQRNPANIKRFKMLPKCIPALLTTQITRKLKRESSFNATSRNLEN